jgi:hypothetical protein
MATHRSPPSDVLRALRALAAALLATLLTLLPALALAAAAVPPAAPAPDQAQVPISEAEQRAFLDHHLDNVTQSEALDYAFRRSGALDAPFEDRVVLSIRLAEGSGKKSVEADYLSGEHLLRLPRLDDAQGNPVVLYFLEADVREMKRRTGGSPAFFRKRIRMALAQAAEVHAVSFDYAGQQAAGTEVRIRPYHGDAMHERLKEMEDKLYVLTFSPQVPGGVYQLRSEVPGAAGAAPALVETLTFAGTAAVKPAVTEVP